MAKSARAFNDLGTHGLDFDSLSLAALGWEDTRPAPLPIYPTFAAPGSEEKMRVMELRASLRQRLFHPSDSTFNGKKPGVIQPADNRRGPPSTRRRKRKTA